MSAPDSLCQCGHPKEAHGPQEYPKGQAKCLATVQGAGAASDFLYPCPCKRFKEAKAVTDSGIGTPQQLRDMTADRDYWLAKAKALEIAHDRLAAKVEAAKEVLHDR